MELDELQRLINTGKEHPYKASVLHHRYSTAALAKVCFFAKFNARNENNETLTFSVAAVSWYMFHPCHVWFGKPTQVWATTLYPGYNFIPVSKIKSRVIHSKASINFGSVIGVDSVYVIVGLDVSKRKVLFVSIHLFIALVFVYNYVHHVLAIVCDLVTSQYNI